MTLLPSILRCLVCALLLSSCSLFFGRGEGIFGDPDGLSVSVTPPVLTIANHTDAAVYTFVVGRATAALINWAPGVEGAGIPPGGTERVRYEDIYKAEAEREVIVYWWQAVVEEGERVPREIEALVVTL